jgi:hypothetical protein
MDPQLDLAQRAEPLRRVGAGRARFAIEIHRPVKNEPMFGNCL